MNIHTRRKYAHEDVIFKKALHIGKQPLPSTDPLLAPSGGLTKRHIHTPRRQEQGLQCMHFLIFILNYCETRTPQLIVPSQPTALTTYLLDCVQGDIANPSLLTPH